MRIAIHRKILVLLLIFASSSYRHYVVNKPNRFAVASTLFDDALAQRIVQGLTDLSDKIFLQPNEVAFIESPRTYKKMKLTTQELFDGIRNDFKNGYLFTGEIDPELYNSNCTFTDPTISFRGLSTFQRNIKAIQPLFKRFLGDSLVVLYDLQINATENSIRAYWRMSSSIKIFPWNPRIELPGNTRYTYMSSSDRDGRIIDYYERWELPALQTLGQLFKLLDKKTQDLLRFPVDLDSTQSKSVKSLDLMSIHKSLFNVPRNAKYQQTLFQNLKKLLYIRRLGLFPNSLRRPVNSTYQLHFSFQNSTIGSYIQHTEIPVKISFFGPNFVTRSFTRRFGFRWPQSQLSGVVNLVNNSTLAPNISLKYLGNTKNDQSWALINDYVEAIDWKDQKDTKNHQLFHRNSAISSLTSVLYVDSECMIVRDDLTWSVYKRQR